MTPFIIARETHGERLVPAWLEVIPERCACSSTSCPTRQQIDTRPEQLIVEHYSKN